MTKRASLLVVLSLVLCVGAFAVLNNLTQWRYTTVVVIAVSSSLGQFWVYLYSRWKKEQGQ